MFFPLQTKLKQTSVSAPIRVTAGIHAEVVQRTLNLLITQRPLSFVSRTPSPFSTAFLAFSGTRRESSQRRPRRCLTWNETKRDTHDDPKKGQDRSRNQPRVTPAGPPIHALSPSPSPSGARSCCVSRTPLAVHPWRKPLLRYCRIMQLPRRGEHEQRAEAECPGPEPVYSDTAGGNITVGAIHVVHFKVHARVSATLRKSRDERECVRRNGSTAARRRLPCHRSHLVAASHEPCTSRAAPLLGVVYTLGGKKMHTEAG